MDRRLCAASDALAGVVSDAGVDGSTRALAALSLGELACRRDSSVRGPARSRVGLSASAQAALVAATAPGRPSAVRQASVRALGRARVASAVTALVELRDGGDPVLRLLAAQALTRITGEDYLDTPLRDAVVGDVMRDAHTYTIIDEEATP